MMASAKTAVRIVEVGPRDGLQNIEKVVQTQTKIDLIKRLGATGLRTIEATSFVSPKWIPQLADSRQVMEAIHPLISEGSIQYPVLVPNMRGLERALEAGAGEVAVFVSATETFSMKNTNCSVAEGLARARKVAEQAIAKGVRVRAYVSCIFADPYEGPTEPQLVLNVTEQLLSMGCYEVSLGDTLGVGSPAQVRKLLNLLLETIPASRLAGHFHDTYGQAVANAVAAYDLGLRVFDTSISGLGGCPYSPGAKGNLATEDLVYTFQEMGVHTGVDLEKLVEVGHWISANISQPNGSRAGAAIYSRTHKLDQGPSAQLRTGGNIRNWITVEDAGDYQILRHKSSIKIVLGRPKYGNTLTLSMLQNLTAFFHRISQDNSVSHVIIAGSGKFFCTGMDLSDNGATTAKASKKAKEIQFLGLSGLFEAIDKLPQTTIALINGPSFGGGVGLAFTCDIRLAASKAAFTLSEGKLGLSPAVISKYIFREWGISFAREAILTARAVSPRELHNKIGTVHGIAEDERGLEVLLNTCLDKLAKVAPKASSKSKELSRAAWSNAGNDEQGKIIKGVFDWMMQPSDEAEFGLNQFRAGKRDINWEDFVSSANRAKL